MSDDTERRLHDQLFALGTIEPAPGLADSALREANQRRRRGIAAIAAAAAVVLAIAVAVPLSLRHNSSGPTTPPPGPVQRNVVVSYLTMSATDPNGTLTVLDPKTGKYVESKLSTNSHAPFALPDLVASPDGQHYATTNGRYVGTLSDVINGNIAGFHHLDPGGTNAAILPAQWSADSSRLLIPNQGVADPDVSVGFRIYDTGTNKLGKLVHLSSKNGRVYDWSADDSGFVGFVEHSKLDFFDLDGKLLRTTAVPGRPDTFSVISPDGRNLALADGLFDLRSGRTNKLQLPPGKQATVPVPLGWLDDDHYAVDWAPSNGKTVEHRILVFTNSGRLVKSIKAPYGTSTLPGTGGKSTIIVMHLGYGADYPANSGLRL